MAFRILGTRVEWLPEAERPATGDVLVIPANDHLWMLSGPGLEIKKKFGKEVELEAVRLGPLQDGEVAVTAASFLGYKALYHAVVMKQDFSWCEGAGRRAIAAALARANRDKVNAMIVYPLWRGAHGRREGPAREMLSGLFEGLTGGSSIRTIHVLHGAADEKALLHETFLQLLASPPA